MAESPSFIDTNVVLRIVKPYAGARNHIYTGTVVGFENGFVALDCCVMHFGRATVDDPTGGLTTSARTLRWVAQQRVEYIRLLPEGADPFKPGKLQVGADGSLDYDALHRPDLFPD